MMTGFDLDSPVGRRMVEAALEGWDDEDRAAVVSSLADALRVALSDTCPTCKGTGMIVESWGEHFSQSQAAVDDCPNPDCKDGKVPPAFYTEEQFLERERIAERAWEAAMERYRAQVVAEIVTWCRSKDAQQYDDPQAHEGINMDLAGDAIEEKFG